MLIYTMESSWYPLQTYAQLIASDHDTRQKLRGIPQRMALRPAIFENDYEEASFIRCPGDALAALLGPCHQLVEITGAFLPPPATGLEEATYHTWIDAAFRDHPVLQSVDLTPVRSAPMDTMPLALRILRHLPNLRSARLTARDPLLEALARGCPRLAHLELVPDESSDSPNLGALRACPELAELTLGNIHLTRLPDLLLPGPPASLHKLDLTADEALLHANKRWEAFLPAGRLAGLREVPSATLDAALPALLPSAALLETLALTDTAPSPLLQALSAHFPNLRVLHTQTQHLADIPRALLARLVEARLTFTQAPPGPTIEFQAAGMQRLTLGFPLAGKSAIRVRCPRLRTVNLLPGPVRSPLRVTFEGGSPDLAEVFGHPCYHFPADAPLPSVRRYVGFAVDGLAAFPRLRTLGMAAVDHLETLEELLAGHPDLVSAEVTATGSTSPRLTLHAGPALRWLLCWCTGAAPAQVIIDGPGLQSLNAALPRSALTLRCPELRRLECGDPEFRFECLVPPLRELRLVGDAACPPALLRSLARHHGDTLRVLQATCTQVLSIGELCRACPGLVDLHIIHRPPEIDYDFRGPRNFRKWCQWSDARQKLRDAPPAEVELPPMPSLRLLRLELGSPAWVAIPAGSMALEEVHLVGYDVELTLEPGPRPYLRVCPRARL
ncbi:hypothetical protein PAPYR_7064 [Paratrimastix pyriformis]|uniref:Leucine-rich repeat domain-containing protein n=1 Tax=Paratrimastix pyriformis TaxID=342808 RepID=A0ABQ8UIC9_9EUKA|nr:hypothetical protein PAPYR_7064 [Paratrimastix pyriformis]